MTTIYVLVYFVGVILAYFSLRESFKRCVGAKYYTAGDRALCMIMSIFSFISVLAALLTFLANYAIDSDDNIAKW